MYVSNAPGKKNHRSDVSDPNVIPACHYYAQCNHDFNTYPKFTLTEMITNRSKPIEVIQDILRKRGNFWINTDTMDLVFELDHDGAKSVI